jgi:hypothetical protein
MQLTRSKTNEDNKVATTLVWWIPLHTVEHAAVRACNRDMTLQYFVWICHALLFSASDAQEDDGAVLVQDLDQIGLVRLFSMIPPS